MKNILLLSLLFCVNIALGQLPLKGLKSYYPFTQNANDFIGENNGTLFGPIPTQDKFGYEKKAYLFDGIDDYIRFGVPDFSNDSVGTFSAWIKFNSLNGLQYVASVGDEQSQNSYLGLIRFDPSTKTLGVYHNTPFHTDWLKGSTIMKTDEFYHVVLTGNSLKWEMYINNKKEMLNLSVGENRGAWFRDVSSIDNFIIGGVFIKPPHTTAYFNGLIDEVRIYNRVLDATEIDVLYNEGICEEILYDTVKVYNYISVIDTLLIDIPSSVNPELINTSIKVFPNPAKDKLTLEFNNNNLANEFKVKIISSTGIEIYNNLITSTEMIIDLQNFQGKGLYFLNILDINNNVIITKKIILN